MKSISFLEEVCIFHICGWEYRNKNCNHCSKMGCWICKSMKYETRAFLAPTAFRFATCPSFVSMVFKSDTLLECGRLPLAFPSSPRKSLSCPHSPRDQQHLGAGTSGLSPCPAELDVQWPVIIKILITRGVDYEQSYFLGLERPAEFNKWLKNDLVFSSN